MALGEEDAYIDRPAKELLTLFRSKAKKTIKFTGAAITGANHGFYKREARLVRVLDRWLDTII